MKRLTISGDACIETLALLITMAWADGRLDDQEREGVRAAASVFNLTKELRERLDQLLEKPIGIDELLVDELSARDKAFAYVAAAWLAGVDDNVHAKEEELLGKLGLLLGFTDERRNELARIARDLEPLRKAGTSWATEIVALFKAIPSRLEGDGTENYEVALEEARRDEPAPAQRSAGGSQSAWT
ncbi:MAG: TerB family tellurite resistance protein [Labilithrix sp.]|nr:TerB family tellurite resistance protein [Labilithrix sp.]